MVAVVVSERNRRAAANFGLRNSRWDEQNHAIICLRLLVLHLPPSGFTHFDISVQLKEQNNDDLLSTHHTLTTMPILRRSTKLLDRACNGAVLPIPKTFTGNNVPFSLKKTRRTWRPNVRRIDLPVSVLGNAVRQVLSDEQEGLTAPGTREYRYPALKSVKMTNRDVRSLSKAGGVEGMLVSGGNGVARGDTVQRKQAKVLWETNADALSFLSRARTNTHAHAHTSAVSTLSSHIPNNTLIPFVPLQLSRPPTHFTSFGRSLRHQLFEELHMLRQDIAAGANEETFELEAPEASSHPAINAPRK